MLRLKAPGKSTSKVEVLNLSPNGLWLLAGDSEYFLPYQSFPWFQKAKISEIYNVKLFHGHHLHWPDLDVDLEIESLRVLEKYPLVYR